MHSSHGEAVEKSEREAEEDTRRNMCSPER